MASKLKHHLGKEIEKFIQDGNLIIGICNGFQTLVNLGLLPGFGGQSFMPEVLKKLTTCRGQFPDLDIGVDGGLNRTTIPQSHHAGANVFDAGTFLFTAPDMADAISALRASLTSAE